MAMVILTASVKRFHVSRVQDFFFVEPFPNYNTVFLCIKMLDVYYKCKDLAREILCLPNIWEYI